MPGMLYALCLADLFIIITVLPVHVFQLLPFHLNLDGLIDICFAERVADDLWLQDMTNINDQGSCFELKPCNITYLRSHEVSSEKFKASTMYQLCLVPPDGTTVLPLEIWYFQNGNKSFPDCHQGRGDTNHNRYVVWLHFTSWATNNRRCAV